MKDETREVTFTQSGIIKKDGRNAVCVRFERKTKTGLDYAEGLVPDASLIEVSGFTKEEEENLRYYLKENSTEIIARAKELNPIKNWFRKG